MANYLITNTTQPFVGLGTLTYNVTKSQIYSVIVQGTETPPSGLVIQVKLNGSTKFTAPTITPTQIGYQFKVSFPCANTDVITAVLSSSSDIDNQLNTVKTSIAVVEGP